MTLNIMVFAAVLWVVFHMMTLIGLDLTNDCYSILINYNHNLRISGSSGDLISIINLCRAEGEKRRYGRRFLSDIE